MALRFNSTALVPPGGWYFVESDGTKITSHSPDALVIAVAKHRGANGIAPGDPTEEVAAQVCHRWPNGCYGHGSRYVPRPVNWGKMGARFMGVAKNLISPLVRGKLNESLVSPEEADHRASICANCAFNKPHYEVRGGCKSCQQGLLASMAEKTIGALRSQIIGNRSTTYNDQLRACANCGCDLKLKVWLKREIINATKEELQDFPDFCWLKG